MNGKEDKPTGIAKLRWRAEEIAQEQAAPSTTDLTLMSREEALKLVHELRVHQIELKMQNEELVRAQAELNTTRERYFDLYNLAPVGYFVVSHEGRILETNLTGVILLGVPRAALVKQPITGFIFKEDQDVYYLHRKELLATGKAHACELRMVKADGTAFWARLTATTQDPSTSSAHGGALVTRVVLSDISEQKQIEQDKAKLNDELQRAKKRPRQAPKTLKAKGGKAHKVRKTAARK
jgi:PAS domain S-box-containing protein